MYFIYTAKYPFFEKYRSHNVFYLIIQKPWPWEEDPAKWRIFLKKTMGTVLFNMFILNILFTSVDILFGEYRYKYSLEDWPTIPEMMSQFFFFLLVEDFTFFWSHYCLHSPEHTIAF